MDDVATLNVHAHAERDGCRAAYQSKTGRPSR